MKKELMNYYWPPQNLFLNDWQNSSKQMDRKSRKNTEDPNNTVNLVSSLTFTTGRRLTSIVEEKYTLRKPLRLEQEPQNTHNKDEVDRVKKVSVLGTTGGEPRAELEVK